jgi:subtilisin family serine protease
MPVKVLGADGGGSSALVAAGIVWATDHGARVISMSLGAPGRSQVLSDAVAYAVTKGVVLIAAAGNNGTTALFYPAGETGVVSVAATNSADVLYDWSNHGSWVNVAAPGCNVAPALGGSYENFCGTSSATPVVAGLAGLALELHPQASIAEVDGALMNGVSVADVQHGRVDVPAMLTTLGVQVPPAVAPAPVTSVVGNWRGRLTRGTATIARTLPGGPLTAVATARAGTRLSVALVSESSRASSSARGRAPLSFARTVKAGRYRIVVRGPSGTIVGLRFLHTAVSGAGG